MRTRIIFCFLALILVTSFHSETASANEDVMARKIDLAGRQRMLSQRIAKAACFISTFNEVDKHVLMLQKSTELFDSSLKTLKDGNKELGIPKETDASLIKQLNEVEELWHISNFASRLLIDFPEYPDADVDLIEEFNLPTLHKSHLIVQLMGAKYSNTGTKNSDILHAINVAGRQRMLSQKAAKEFCQISYGNNIEAYKEALKKTVSEFDQALNDLKNGNERKNIPKPPTDEIYQQLVQVTSYWQNARKVMLAAANGKRSVSKDFNVVSFTNEVVLQQSNRAVQMLVDYRNQAIAKSQ